MFRNLCPKHFVTTNNVGLLDVLYRFAGALCQNLDFVALDNYPGFFEMLMQGSRRWKMPPDAIMRDDCHVSRFRALREAQAFHDHGRTVGEGGPEVIFSAARSMAGSALDLSSDRTWRHGRELFSLGYRNLRS